MNLFSDKENYGNSGNISMNDDHLLLCEYKDCRYAHDGMCGGGLYQCAHYCERAKVCLVEFERDLEELKGQERYENEYYAELSGLERRIYELKKLAGNLDVCNINVVVKVPIESYYETSIDARTHGLYRHGNQILEYRNGIGTSITPTNVGQFESRLYAGDIYYYEMKRIIQCEVTPQKKIVFQNEKNEDKICFMCNPEAESEGKPYNFTYKGEDYYGTVVFYKERGCDKKHLDLGRKEIDLVRGFINRLTYK